MHPFLEVAITYDDGPSGNELAAASALNGAKATFFLNGGSFCSAVWQLSEEMELNDEIIENDVPPASPFG